MKQQLKLLIKVGLSFGTLFSLFYVPWIFEWTWILPLSDTVQEQASGANDHGFDGIIVYVAEASKSPDFHGTASPSLARLGLFKAYERYRQL